MTAHKRLYDLKNERDWRALLEDAVDVEVVKIKGVAAA